MTNREVDDVSGVETTGHEWDGIKELNNPMPRWWLWTFYGTIVFSVGYVIAYPAIPLINGATQGVLGYSSRAEFAGNMAAAQDARSEELARIASMDVGAIIADDELARFARAGGSSAYKIYCSQCHGSGAQGAAGYPNLNDDEWIWGGTPREIYTTIAHGVRYEADMDTRFNQMPAFGDMLERDDIRNVAAYVVSLSDGVPDSGDIEAGSVVFADNCAGCHGENAEGITELGAPALNNPVWLYGDGSMEDVMTQISDPSHGVMPAWASKLGDTAVKQLAVYVHSLGGGQ